VTRREVTLFLNGTVRLRQGALGHEQMMLEELPPDAVQDVLRALRSIQDGPERTPGTVPTLRTGGDWVGRCRFTLSLPAGPPETFEFAEFDTLPLFLRKLVDLADVLSEDVEPLSAKARLPSTYEPELDDILVDGDGFRWVVVRFTTDDRAVEVRGLDQPFTRYVDREAIRELFIGLEEKPGR
jgi:hypothetical protein